MLQENNNLQENNVATKCAVISCNVSFKYSIDEHVLVKIFKEKINIDEWESHLDVFFNEVPEGIIRKFMSENDLSISDLAKVFFSLPKIYQGRRFLENIYAK